MHGFKAHYDADPQYADGGQINPARRKLGFSPRGREQAQDADPAQRVSGDQASVRPAPTRREPTREASSTGAADRRLEDEEQRQGFKAGGRIGGKRELPPVDDGDVDIIRGPGTGTSDDVPAEMEKGTHILPAKTTEDVLLSNGEAAVSPAVVSAVGQAALDALRAATDEGGADFVGGMPGMASRTGVAAPGERIDAAPLGFNPRDQGEEIPKFAVGGTVGEEDERNRNAQRMYVLGAQTAAAARPAPAVAPVAAAADPSQIPTASGALNTPTGVPVTGNELTRNLGNAAAGFAPAAGALARGVSAGARLVANALPASGAARTALAGAGAAGALATGDTNTAPAGFTPGGMTAPSAPAPGVAPVAPATAAAARTTAPPLAVGGINDPTQTPASPPAAAAPTAPGLAEVNVMPAFQATPTETFLPQGFQPQRFTQAAGTDWQARKDLANAQTGASSIVNSPQRAQQAALAAALLAQQGQAQRDAGTANVAEIQGRTQQAVADTRAAVDLTTEAGRNQVAQGRLANETAEGDRRNRAADLTQAQAQQLATAQRAVLEAATPAARKTAEDNLRALQGQYEKPNRLVVVPGAKNADGSQDASTVYDASTGMPVNAQPAGQATNAGASTRPKGTVSEVNGKRAVWDGTKWVPQ